MTRSSFMGFVFTLYKINQSDVECRVKGACPGPVFRHVLQHDFGAPGRARSSCCTFHLLEEMDQYSGAVAGAHDNPGRDRG